MLFSFVDIITSRRVSLTLILTVHRPGFNTRGDGILPDSPETVVKTGSDEFLNWTFKYCSLSLGLSGVTLMAPITVYGFGFTNLIKYNKATYHNNIAQQQTLKPFCIRKV